MTEYTQTGEDEAFRDAAVSIASDIDGSALDLSGGRVGHVGYMFDDEGVTLKTKPGLYCGPLGVAVYFSALYAVTGDEQYARRTRKHATHVLNSSVDSLFGSPDVGAGTGVGSTLYGLSVLAELTGDSVYRERAHELATAFDRSVVEEDDQYDVLLGTAGTVLGLLAYYERFGDETALTAAHHCGEYLLTERYTKWNDYQVWDTSQVNNINSTAVGMGHGVAGIAYALFRLYGHTGEETFREAAANAVTFENTFYTRSEQQWQQNFSVVEHYTDWWCSGLVGVGTARLGSVEHCSSETLQRDLDRAEQGLDPSLLREDSLCHGTVGVIDFLVELGRKRGGESLDRARHLAADVLQRRRTTGQYRVAPLGVSELTNPVLFLGTAGIGYTLLRLLAPETLPSLLRFE